MAARRQLAQIGPLPGNTRIQFLAVFVIEPLPARALVGLKHEAHPSLGELARLLGDVRIAMRLGCLPALCALRGHALELLVQARILRAQAPLGEFGVARAPTGGKITFARPLRAVAWGCAGAAKSGRACRGGKAVPSSPAAMLHHKVLPIVVDRPPLDARHFSWQTRKIKHLGRMGWPMGFEPTTTGITIQDSTVELRPPRKTQYKSNLACPAGLEPATLSLEG